MRRHDTDFDDEIESHLQLEADRIAGETGLDAVEAMAEARRRFGNVTSHRERFFESSRLMFLERWRRDVRLAVRRLIHERRVTATAVTTIALCLGGNLAIFAAVDAVLLRPLPFADGDQLVTIYNTYPGADVPDDGASVANYYERRNSAALPSIARNTLALFRDTTAIVGESGATEREDVTAVTPEFFAALGVQPALGRLFNEGDLDGTGERAVVITDAAWRRHFNADPLAIGRALRVDGEPFLVAGVLPASFQFLSSKASIYGVYLSRPEQRESRVRHSGSGSQMIARLAPGASVASAQAEIDAQNATLERSDPEAAMMAAAGFRSVVVSLHDRHVAPARPVLLLLQLGALSLFAIGAVNLMNLLIVRAAGRAKESAVRTAIGATRWDLARSVIAETVTISLAGSVVGIGVGAAGVRVLARLGADKLPLGAFIALDARLIVLALFAAVVAGVALAIPVAWFTIHSRMPNDLHSQGRTGTASRRLQRLRHGFVVAQIALAFVLLSAAGLLSLSLDRVLAAPKGFSPDHTLTGHVTLPIRIERLRAGFLRADRIAFADRLVNELEQQPGVVAAAVSSNVPLSGDDIKSAATVPGAEDKAASPAPHASYSYWVSRDYFKAMGMALVSGRVFDASDAARNARVAVIDADFARRNFPRGNALGGRVFAGSRVGPDEEAFVIVGVVEPAKQPALTDATQQGAVYYPTAFYTNNAYFIVVRGTGVQGSEGALAPTLVRIVRGIDPDLPVSDIRTMTARVSDSAMMQRSPAVVTLAFAALALLLATIGTHGVISYAVASRRREIGVRLALGARPSQIGQQFLWLGGRLLLVGAIPGLAGAVIAGRFLEQLFGVPPFHLQTIVLVSLLMTVVMAIACLAPSRRAARISPMTAMSAD